MKTIVIGTWLSDDEQLCNHADLPLASKPTSHRPGSPGKLRVMAQRATARRAVFHPRDCTYPVCRRSHAPRGGGKRGPRPVRKPDGSVRGVQLNAGRYQCQVRHQGRTVYLGRYGSRAEAEAAVLDFWRDQGREVG